MSNTPLHKSFSTTSTSRRCRIHRHDENHYTLGRIGKHNVVMAVLPSGEHGVAAAARVAKDMRHTFPNVRACLMVGIGGGAPSEDHDIRLGDVVVSTPSFHPESRNPGGVIQYDHARTMQAKRFQSMRYLSRPPDALLSAAPGIHIRHNRKGNTINRTIEEIFQQRPRMRREYSRGTRPRRSSDDDPTVHYGLIASADNFIENAEIRDLLAKELNVLCFEMEAAGLINNFPCIVKEVEILRQAVLDDNQKTVLERLPVAPQAAFISYADEHNPRCLPNTRVELLDEIMAQAGDPDAESVFWLNGMAGTGKCTISRSVADAPDQAGKLGASFFFKRGEEHRDNPSKLLTTMASQLATRRPAKMAQEQFEKLIRQPLLAGSPPGQSKRIIFLVDALDKCDVADRAKLVLRIFRSYQNLGLQLFITSRPEEPIRLRFVSIKSKYQDIILQEITQASIRRDLALYFRNELERISRD
ncbi:phosphorylase superfamily protein [Hirsutella rhossiliensis]|uniref:Phosphorylase superfamily domain-containing protein n=1 Tax=Hirsutella rhossiliensis TaxID=111463 RepID=A0A9P8MNG6_9HYPO|nr:phosphorylase superfamily domain-containing protein [Hirsutella rhossiliensis]KAH0958239.1 phosphorylase superfamily domain-containing protein [Hirsutella rhossiliensis]